jgi:tetratricopeptide (TPR) repeat protein
MIILVGIAALAVTLAAAFVESSTSKGLRTAAHDWAVESQIFDARAKQHLADLDLEMKAIDLKMKASDYLAAGMKKERANDFDGAIAAFSNAIDLQPDDAFNYVLRFEARVRRQEWEGAKEDFSRIAQLSEQLDPNDARLIKGLMSDWLASFKLEERLKRNESSLESRRGVDFSLGGAFYPPSPPGGEHLLRGLAMEHQGDSRGAINEYSAAIQLAPDDPMAYILRGHAREQLGDIAGADADHAHARKLEGRQLGRP